MFQTARAGTISAPSTFTKVAMSTSTDQTLMIVTYSNLIKTHLTNPFIVNVNFQKNNSRHVEPEYRTGRSDFRRYYGNGTGRDMFIM